MQMIVDDDDEDEEQQNNEVTAAGEAAEAKSVVCPSVQRLVDSINDVPLGSGLSRSSHATGSENISEVTNPSKVLPFNVHWEYVSTLVTKAGFILFELFSHTMSYRPQKLSTVIKILQYKSIVRFRDCRNRT